jgi:hypothetical protein
MKLVNMLTLKVICINEPDISYTRNKKLILRETYMATYEEVKLNGYGLCPLYKVYDMDSNLLGEYYARDFMTIQEYRDKKLEDILS